MVDTAADLVPRNFKMNVKPVPTLDAEINDIRMKTAEIVKLWENSFFAAKIAFVNEMALLCNKLGINFLEARELWLQDLDGYKVVIASAMEFRPG